MKKISLAITALILLVVLFLVMGGKNVSGSALLNESAKLYLYSVDKNSPTGSGFLEISFSENSEDEWFLNIFTDSTGNEKVAEEGVQTITLANGDQIEVASDPFKSDSSWPLKNVPITLKANTLQRFSLQTSQFNDGTTFTALLSSRRLGSKSDSEELETRTLNVSSETVQVASLLGLDVPGAREDLKRGIGLVAYADSDHISGPDMHLGRENPESVPDLSGGPMDCFPIAATNNIISLVEENDSDVDLPPPREMIEELKRDMNFKDGIINANFLTGKAAFIERYELPITTVEIKRPSMDDILDAFASGGAVEISTTMLRSSSGRDNTGHVLTGMGAFRDGDDAGVSAHDPATPEGTDHFDITQTGGDKPYLMINYGLWDGITIIDAIFVQTWHQDEGSGVIIEEEEEEETEEEIKIGGDLELGKDPLIEMAYNHTSPGQYSEVYVSVTHLPKTDITVQLKGPAVDAPAKQVIMTDEDGVAHFTFKIFSYGKYDATITLEGSETAHTKSVNVQ
ncbi:MAG: hypothetical protein OEY44_02795 [Candidatus Peregrinibacteria bacterium]|nr:hypothetical protein [Candidatus Peregrinibacteria bacterium]